MAIRRSASRGRVERVLGGVIKIDVSPEGHKTITAHLMGKLFKEEGMWIITCPPLDLSTCGATKQEALVNITEAVKIFFTYCLEKGTLERVLKKLRWSSEIGDFNLDGFVAPKSAPNLPPAFMLKPRLKGNSWTGKLELQS